jgi:hypothetical protein
MSLTKRVGRLFKPFVNFPKWMGLTRLVANARGIKKSIEDIRVHRPTVRVETFEQAMTRLHLTEKDIELRKRTCLILSIVYSLTTFLLLIYTLYLIIHLRLGAIIGLLITGLMAVFAYRESFWHFQMKTRKLGNTYRDWLSYMLRRGK